MSVSLEKIDMLMERANISYKEAKEALEVHNGDMVEALIHLEASQKTTGQKQNQYKKRPQNHQAPKNDFFEDAGRFFQKMHKTSFIIGKKGHRLLDIPLTIAAVVTLFTLPFSFFFLILPYFFGYKIVLVDPNGKKMKIDESFNFGEAPEKKNEDLDRRA